jgi:hypothetical protein
MKKLTLEIKPLEGFGELEFGATKDEVFEYLGKPDEDEVFTDEEEGDTLVCHFWGKAVSAFFENLTDPVLNNLETDNPDATLFGKLIFTMKEDEVKQLMIANGFTEIDEEVMESEEFDNEKRVSFDEAMVDFFFEEELLTAISWGVFLEVVD